MLLTAEATEHRVLCIPAARRIIIRLWKKQEASLGGVDPIQGHPQLRTAGSSTPPNKHDHSPTALVLSPVPGIKICDTVG